MERVLDIYEKERSMGVIVSVGGQIANNLAMPLHRQGVQILGTSPIHIDRAEDRHQFSTMLDQMGIDQPLWKELTTPDDIKAFVGRVGYPVLVRPSYVLSGKPVATARSPDPPGTHRPSTPMYQAAAYPVS